MKNFKNEFSKKLMGEEIRLPESLSAENIEKLINEQGEIIDPKRKRNYKAIKAVKWCSAVAAALVLLVGIGAVVESSTGVIEKQRNEEIVEDYLAVESDYSEIENAVLTYFKDWYNDRNYNNYYFTNGFDVGTDSVADAESAPGTPSSSNTGITAQTSSTSGFSETNTQVKGVDEADIVKTDGRYIYSLTDSKVIITDCSDAGNMKIVSEIELFESDATYYAYAVEMYLYGDKIAVVTQQEAAVTEYPSEETYTDNEGTVTVITCDCYAPNMDTVIRVFDISDIEKPELSFEQKINGDYLSSRMIGGKLLAVTRYDIPYSYIHAENFEDSCIVLKDKCIPSYALNGGKEQRIATGDIQLLNSEDPSAYVVTALIDLDNVQSEPEMNAALGSGYEMYCTSENLYIASMEYGGYDSDNTLKDSNGEQFWSVTHIYKYKITNEGVEYTDCVTVGGTMINQFAMDESNGMLRVATNGSKVYASESINMVYVIGSDMKIKGYLGDIAPGEDMKSARFMGDMLYLVTFYQTDPLFVVDLSDATAPKVAGELKIPGFSSYLHPIGNGLVIGIGVGGTLSGVDGTAKISLFDVSDPAEPKELDNYTTSAYADFNEDHKAFVTIDENTYAVPCTENGGTEKILVFSIENGGIVIDNYYYCPFGESWYETARCVYIGDVLFAVNYNGIFSYDLTTEEKIGELYY